MTRESNPPGLLEVGRIGKPNGVRGDLMVSFTSDLDERRRVGAVFTVTIGGQDRSVTVAAIRPQKDRWVVHFEGVEDRTAAERLVNKTLFAEPIDVEGALWVHELIGSKVVEVSGTERGTCVGVIENPAHDILELSTGALVPVTFVVSTANGVTLIDPPEGLFDLAD